MSDFTEPQTFPTPEQEPQELPTVFKLPDDYVLQEEQPQEGTISAAQLLEREKNEDYDHEYYRRKSLITQIKVIGLYRMDVYPLLNPSTFMKRDKDRLIEKMEEILNTMTPEEINKEFNRVCNETIFYNGADLSKIPVFDESRFTTSQQIRFKN